jgi:hypothetical protein
MDLTEGSETSEKLNLTPGKYPKENIQDSEHDENLKSSDKNNNKNNEHRTTINTEYTTEKTVTEINNIYVFFFFCLAPPNFSVANLINYFCG